MLKKILMWVGIVFVVLVVIGIFAGGKESPNATSAESNSEQTAQTVQEEAPIQVKASELLNAYKNNEIAANQQFKDKSLLVTAIVESIEADLMDEPYLVLKAGDQFEFNKPQAHLAKSDANKAATLNKGQQIVLRCIGNSEIGGTPMLKDCVIQ